MGFLENLDYLFLQNNQITGMIPDILCELDINWGNPYFFNISNNLLCPPYPSCLDDGLGEQDAIECDGVVELWDTLYYVPEITELLLSSTDLSGTIPSEIGSFTNLISLDLSYNDLTGPIPNEIGNLDSLQYLNLSYNVITGDIPASIGNLNNLIELRLYSNELTGSIPSEIGNLSRLEYLNIFNNQISGDIPTVIGNLVDLTKLYLHSNQITGNIPEEIYGLANLTNLYLSNNNLIGQISSAIENLESLERLKLQNNELSNTLPEVICNLELEWNDPIVFNITNNRFCAPYPNCVDGYEGNQDTSYCGEIGTIVAGMNIEYALKNAYPNPFNPSTNIKYNIAQYSMVELYLFDIMGEKIKTLFFGMDTPGSKTIKWNGRNSIGSNVAPGIYFCKLSSNHYTKTIKLILLK